MVNYSYKKTIFIGIALFIYLLSSVLLAEVKTYEHEQAMEIFKELIEHFNSNPLKNNLLCGTGTARVRKYENDKLTETRQLHFKFKDRLSRSDYYKVKENDEQEFVCTWSVHRKGALTYNHMQVLGIIPKPAAEFYRQVGYDFCPDTYNKLYGLEKPIHEMLASIYNTSKANNGILGCHMDDKGVLHFSISNPKTKKTSYFAFDTTKGYRLVSYFYPFPGSFKAEWVKQGESKWYIKSAEFQDGPFKTEVEIQDFQFVEDIPDSEFTVEALNIPPGATVVDQVLGIHYRYGETPIMEKDLNEALKQSELFQNRPKELVKETNSKEEVVSADKNESDIRESTSQSSQEQDSSQWLTVVVFIVLGIIIVFILMILIIKYRAGSK